MQCYGTALTIVKGEMAGFFPSVAPGFIVIKIISAFNNEFYCVAPNTDDWREIFTRDRIGEQMHLEGVFEKPNILYIKYVLPDTIDWFLLGGAL